MTIKETNLTPYKGTIKAGQRLVKVGDMWMPVGVGGGTGDTSAFEAAALAIIGDESTIPDIPVPETPSGSSIKFYQCTTVDTESKTWSGKELVLTDGVYVVSDTETTGLVYGSGFTPIVGTIYDENTLFVISTLFTPSDTLEGCVFAANMQTTSAMYNGETVNLEGVILADAPGYEDGTQALTKTSATLLDGITGSEIFADGNISIVFSAYTPNAYDNGNLTEKYIKLVSDNGTDICYLIQLHSNGTLVNQFSAIAANYISLSIGANSIIPYGWNHFVLIYNHSEQKAYLYANGVQIKTGTHTGYTADYFISAIQSISSIQTAIDCNSSYMKDLQIYNRVLDEAEIADLYSKAKLPITA